MVLNLAILRCWKCFV